MLERKAYPHSLQIKGVFVVRKLGRVVRGSRCVRDEGVEVKLRVVYVRLEFGQVFMRTEIGSEENRKGERD